MKCVGEGGALGDHLKAFAASVRKFDRLTGSGDRIRQVSERKVEFTEIAVADSSVSPIHLRDNRLNS